MIDRIRDIVLRMRQKPKFLVDELKSQFISITKFFDYVTSPLINLIKPFRDIDIPLSSRYNKFLDNVETDINLIHGIQGDILDNMVMSWNAVENSYPEDIQPESPYDDDFTLEHNDASVISDRITLGVKAFTSVTSEVKGKPLMNAICSEKSIDVYYGKAWGALVSGNESGEDGIRVANNNGSVIIDDKDTFWEAEAVILQDDRENTKFLQPVVEKDVSLTVTTKFIFKNPVSVNTITVRPYNAAVSAYYRLIKAEVSDGIIIVPINVKETFVMKETVFVFDVPTKLRNRQIRSLNLTFKQDTGYFMKYTLGYFKIKNNESWVDVTGPHVVYEAKRMDCSSRTP